MGRKRRVPSPPPLAARMGHKRRVPSPPPPPPPPQEESSSSSEEEVEATPATQKSPKPPSTTATVDDSDSSDGSDEESSDSGKIDAEAFELRQIAASSGKRAAAAASEVESEDHEPIPPGKAKKGKAGAEKAAREPSPSVKAKKAKSRAAEKAPSEVSPSSEGKKKHKAQPEKTTPSGKSEKPGQLRRWTTEDEIKVLEALVRHVKANGTQPGAGELIAAVGGSLQRKNCRNTEMYEKVRNFRVRYEKAVSTGNLPVKGDDLLKFELSEQVWGENAKQVAAASMALNDAGSPKSKKKGRTSKEKTDGYSNGGAAKEATTSADENVGTATERSKGQVTEEKLDEDTKGRSSKNVNIVETPAKNKKRGNHKELEGDAKAGTTNTKKTVHTASANGGTSVRSKSGKSDRERKDEDADSPRPKEATTATQNDRSLTLLKEGKIHEEKMDTDANVKGTRKGFDELQNLYPNLTSCAESIQAQHPCGETLKRAFEFIDDEKAHALESKLKKQRVAELRMETRLADTTKLVTNTFIGLLD